MKFKLKFLKQILGESTVIYLTPG